MMGRPTVTCRVIAVAAVGGEFWGFSTPGTGQPNFKSLNGNVRGPQYFQERWHPTARCGDDVRLGNSGDGGKWVCSPDCLWTRSDCAVMKRRHETMKFQAR